MVVVVIVLAVVAVAALAAVASTRRRLGAQRALTAAAEQRAAARTAEVAARTAELEARSTELATAAGERAAATELAAERAEQARLADERAAASEAAGLAAVEATTAAEQRALAAESTVPERDHAETGTPPEPDASATATAPDQHPAETGTPPEPDASATATAPAAGLDADVVWILEQARTERTWRFSVATGRTSESVFEGAGDPLLAALQVELDAAREDVGAIVELDAELPDGVSSAASVLTLRAAQELLADIVRRSEETVLRLRADVDDLVLDVESVDEDGQPVLPRPLAIPRSPAVTTTETGVRIHHAFATPPD